MQIIDKNPGQGIKFGRRHGYIWLFLFLLECDYFGSFLFFGTRIIFLNWFQCECTILVVDSLIVDLVSCFVILVTYIYQWYLFDLVKKLKRVGNRNMMSKFQCILKKIIFKEVMWRFKLVILISFQLTTFAEACGFSAGQRRRNPVSGILKRPNYHKYFRL